MSLDEAFRKGREAALLNIAGEGFRIDDESFGCDQCGVRIPHNGNGVADYCTDMHDNVLCAICGKLTDLERSDDA